jgi:hypothetical protein
VRLRQDRAAVLDLRHGRRRRVGRERVRLELLGLRAFQLRGMQRVNALVRVYADG